MIKNSKQLTSHGMKDLRIVCLKILEGMLEEIRGDKIIERKVKIEDNILKIGDFPLALNFNRIFVVGFGKASGEMALGLERILGDRIDGGIINTDHPVALRKIRVNITSHPLPDEYTVRKSKEIVNFLNRLDKNDLVIFLLSGGASSLFEVPADGVGIEDIRRITETMIRGGYDIERINRMRVKLSAVKGGKLLRYINQVEHITLVLSDIIGNPKYVGSGPTYSEDGRYIVIGDNQDAKNIAEKVAMEFCQEAKISSLILRSEPKNIAKEIYEEFRESDEKVVIWGGETTVDVGGASGIGGRNQELALYLAKFIELQEACFACIGTDGIDGPTDAAGGLVDGLTLKRLEERRISIDDILKNHNSYTVLKKLGDVIITGPTGSNVADICIGVKRMSLKKKSSKYL